MGSSDRIEVNTLKILHAKLEAFVQQITKSVDCGVKRPDYNGTLPGAEYFLEDNRCIRQERLEVEVRTSLSPVYKDRGLGAYLDDMIFGCCMDEGCTYTGANDKMHCKFHVTLKKKQ